MLIKNHIAGKPRQTNEPSGGREDLFWTSRKSTRRDELTSQNVGNLCALSFIKIPGEPTINSQNRESVQGRKQLPLELLLISVKFPLSLCTLAHAWIVRILT